MSLLTTHLPSAADFLISSDQQMKTECYTVSQKILVEHRFLKKKKKCLLITAKYRTINFHACMCVCKFKEQMEEFINGRVFIFVK